MHIEWYGQSSFRLTDGSATVFIDPFADMTPLLDRGMRWDYPAIERRSSPAFDLDALPGGDSPLFIVPAAP